MKNLQKSSQNLKLDGQKHKKNDKYKLETKNNNK